MIAYDYTLLYRLGKGIARVDALSCLPPPSVEVDPLPPLEVLILGSLPEPSLHATDSIIMSTKDPVLVCVLN